MTTLWKTFPSAFLDGRHHLPRKANRKICRNRSNPCRPQAMETAGEIQINVRPSVTKTIVSLRSDFSPQFGVYVCVSTACAHENKNDNDDGCGGSYNHFNRARAIGTGKYTDNENNIIYPVCTVGR